MNEIVAFILDLSSGDRALLAALALLMILELVIHRSATRKRRLI
jgi:hypothetical protein